MGIRQVIEPNLEAVLFGSHTQLFGNLMGNNVVLPKLRAFFVD
jgi:hypothetical protein